MTLIPAAVIEGVPDLLWIILVILAIIALLIWIIRH